MLSVLRPSFAVLLLCLLLPNTDNAGEFTGTKKIINLAADVWAPYNLLPDSVHQGYAVEIAEEIFAAAGYDVRYHVVPWARAVSDGERGLFDGIIGSARTRTTAFIFPEEEILREQYSFYTVTSSNWKFSGRNSLNSIRLAAVKGYSYNSWLNEYISEHAEDPSRVHFLFGNEPVPAGLKVLLAGRADVLVDLKSVILYNARLQGVSQSIRFAGADPQPVTGYIAFSRKNPEAAKLATLFDQGIRTMRNNGRLQKILSQYGITDWK